MQVDVALQWGSGYDSVLPLVRERHRHPGRRRPRHRLRAGAWVGRFPGAAQGGQAAEERRRHSPRKTRSKAWSRSSRSGCPSRSSRGRPKEVLGTPAVTKIVQQVVSSQLSGYLENPPRGAKQQARAVLEKVISAAKARIAAREHRDNQRRKSALASCPSLPGQAGRLPFGRRPQRAVHRRGGFRARDGQAGQGLGVPGAAADPRQDPQRAEGLAGGHAQERRVRGDHPGDRGRVGQLIRPGLGPVPAGDPDERRRRRRRAHPRTLLLTLFHRYLRPMLDAGRIFAAVPPLHRIELSNVRKGQDELHVLRRGAEPDAAGTGAARPAVEGARPAVRGPR